jgi:hypothetical protein
MPTAAPWLGQAHAGPFDVAKGCGGELVGPLDVEAEEDCPGRQQLSQVDYLARLFNSIGWVQLNVYLFLETLLCTKHRICIQN